MDGNEKEQQKDIDDVENSEELKKGNAKTNYKGKIRNRQGITRFRS